MLYNHLPKKLFMAHSTYMHCETFSFMMSHPAMSLGDRFCVSRKGRTRGGGWVHLKFANSVAVERPWLELSPCRDSIFSLVKINFSGWHFPRGSLLIGGYG